MAVQFAAQIVDGKTVESMQCGGENRFERKRRHRRVERRLQDEMVVAVGAVSANQAVAP